jgi:hypothetical protein
MKRRLVVAALAAMLMLSAVFATTGLGIGGVGISGGTAAADGWCSRC